MRTVSKVRHRSLKHKPGAMKRKEKLVKGEMGRFQGNLAQLAAVREDAVPSGKMEVEGGEEDAAAAERKTPEQAPAKTSTKNRWAMLRGFIENTMEQNPAFVGNA